MSDLPQKMKAIVRTKAGGADVLQLQADYVMPQPKKDHVLIKAKGEFTSDELFTENPPKILGEECVGTVANNGGVSTFAIGDAVATWFCGIGKVFDGAYAEYTLAPAAYCYNIQTKLEMHVLGAIPATFITAWGSLHRALHIQKGDAVLIHGGTSSVGTAAIVLAKRAGCHVAATTRQSQKADQLKQTGADVVLIDNGEQSLADQLKQHQNFGKGAQWVLELVGPDKINEAFTCTAAYGTVCVTGVLTKVWKLDDWSPANGSIESGKKITTYQNPRDDDHDGIHQALTEIVKAVEDGEIKVDSFIGKTLRGLEGVVEGHRLMENSEVQGKVVVQIA